MPTLQRDIKVPLQILDGRLVAAKLLRRMLVVDADAQSVVDLHLAERRGDLAGQQLEERGLAHTVVAHNGDAADVLRMIVRGREKEDAIVIR